MALYIPENRFHSDKNNISLSWQKTSISRAGLESSIRPQCVVSLDPWYRSICYPGIQ